MQSLLLKNPQYDCLASRASYACVKVQVALLRASTCTLTRKLLQAVNARDVSSLMTIKIQIHAPIDLCWTSGRFPGRSVGCVQLAS